MEYIKIARVDNVQLHRKGVATTGTLHLTTHHLIFSSDSLPTEFWFPYPLIHSTYKNFGSTLISKLKNDHQNQLQGKDSQRYRAYQGKDLWSFVNIKIVSKEYTVFSLDFSNDIEARLVYETILKRTVLSSINLLYAFIYTPNRIEAQFNDSWKLHDPILEFKRQGIDLDSKNNPQWRISDINKDYTFCPTYPAKLVVPITISDTLLNHASKYRSQNRIPVLSYYYKQSDCVIIRSSQPMPGLINQRSIQDEKLIQESLHSLNDSDPNISFPFKNLIIDARPKTNAFAQMALGGGTESIDNYNFNGSCKKKFLGIDNIHVVSDTMGKIIERFGQDGDVCSYLEIDVSEIGKGANWLKLNRQILEAVEMLVKSIVFNRSNLLIHCSDGWDRTNQVCSLLGVCLDPYYRTLDGFMVLIEKDWVSFGHNFLTRCGHLNSESSFHDNTIQNSSVFNNSNISSSTGGGGGNNINGDVNDINDNDDTNYNEDNPSSPFTSTLLNSDILNKLSERFNKRTIKNDCKFVSPVFIQFLDCIYQLQHQNPNSFEFNERFLRRLIYHLYSCQYGTFLSNCERDMITNGIRDRSRSVWDYFRARRKEFTNVDYKETDMEVEMENIEENEDWLLPDLKKVEWWWQLYGRKIQDRKKSKGNRHRNKSRSKSKGKNQSKSSVSKDTEDIVSGNTNEEDTEHEGTEHEDTEHEDTEHEDKEDNNDKDQSFIQRSKESTKNLGIKLSLWGVEMFGKK